MIRTGAAALLLLLAGSAQDTPVARAQQGSLTVRHRQIIIRVPSGPPRAIAPAGASLIKWRESRGPNCIAATRLIGATLLSQNSVDLILRDNSRIRARLEQRCPALDYYYGFYITPNPDGMVCEDRDNIRSRMGGACEIDDFRSLEPVVRR